MSSAAPYRVVAHLSIIFVCVLVCDGRLLDLGQHKREGDDVYDNGHSLQQTLIQFPALDEMTSGERAENRQRARKVATIVEKGLHMLANDILQMWAITRTEGGGGETPDTDEIADNVADPEAVGAVVTNGAEATEEVEPDNTEGDDTSPAVPEGGSNLDSENDSEKDLESIPEIQQEVENVPGGKIVKTEDLKNPTMDVELLEGTLKGI